MAVRLARNGPTGQLHVAVASTRIGRDAGADSVGDRSGEIAADAPIVIFGVGHLGLALPLITRCDRIDQNSAAGRVTAVERALRSFQDLDVVDAGKVDVRALRRGLVEAVNVD